VQPSNQAQTINLSKPAPSFGFWRAWALVVGSMIGNGIFMLPAVLAPYGLNSIWGWLTGALGTIAMAFMFGYLARRMPLLGGPYAYAQWSLGFREQSQTHSQHSSKKLIGFLVAWGFWMSYWAATSAAAIAVVGYLNFFLPTSLQSQLLNALMSVSIIWLFTGINMSGVRRAGIVQLVTTLLKIMPLFAIAAGGMIIGDVSTVAPTNPEQQSFTGMIATMVLIVMWAYVGIEYVTIPAEDVINPRKTIPRALIIGTLTTTVIYISATLGVMALVGQSQLIDSSSPFADAANVLFGPIGASLVALGAIISIVGAMNGNILVSGQLVRAIARDGNLPKQLANLNKRHVPEKALLVSGILSTLLVLANYSQGLVAAYTTVIIMSGLVSLVAYSFSAIAGMQLSKIRYLENKVRAIRAFIICLFTLCFLCFAIIGSGLNALLLGLIFYLIGIPLYFWLARQT
jgi:basic amino acid/polyamine antiporter, APA family